MVEATAYFRVVASLGCPSNGRAHDLVDDTAAAADDDVERKEVPATYIAVAVSKLRLQQPLLVGDGGNAAADSWNILLAVADVVAGGGTVHRHSLVARDDSAYLPDFRVGYHSKRLAAGHLHKVVEFRIHYYAARFLLHWADSLLLHHSGDEEDLGMAALHLLVPHGEHLHWLSDDAAVLGNDAGDSTVGLPRMLLWFRMAAYHSYRSQTQWIEGSFHQSRVVESDVYLNYWKRAYW